ncbi:MAG: thiamine-phosphate kinase [Gammaproteobacteria bacterium]|nr:thiamine-phosphate kinase [Gammaproteobacteria bacterium]
MAQGEFEIIRDYFTHPPRHPQEIILSVGDDAAVVRSPQGYDTVIAIDTLNEGVHFSKGTAAEDIGWKALAVNLSDMAAMGAMPKWFTLALSLPKAEAGWLSRFAAGLFELADQYEMDLIGGDTTRGPLSITLQIGGWVRSGKFLQRCGAQPGDQIYVSGSLGDAALALELLQASRLTKEPQQQPLQQRLHRPSPRVALGMALIDMATSCIDVSDGLAADLGHILTASNVGARIIAAALPRSAMAQQVMPSLLQALPFMLHGGDDYELCFTVPQAQVHQVKQLSETLACPVTAIGEITLEPILRLVDAGGNEQSLAPLGYQHFQ